MARKTIRASDSMSRAALQLTRSCDISALVILTIISALKIKLENRSSTFSGDQSDHITQVTTFAYRYLERSSIRTEWPVILFPDHLGYLDTRSIQAHLLCQVKGIIAAPLLESISDGWYFLNKDLLPVIAAFAFLYLYLEKDLSHNGPAV